jgi:cytochrome c oxidase cbb3-type subunit 3
MNRVLSLFAAALAVGGTCVVLAQQRGGPAQSPGSVRPPALVTPQTYTPEQIRNGQTRFASQCGLCHGRDAFGSDTGPDLSRSLLVAQDNRGDKIGPLVKAGRVDKGMPAFDLNEADMLAVVAYVHAQKAKMDAEGGGRRQVDVSQLQTGNADAGKRYFDGNCASCHSAEGDLKGVGTRYQGLPLMTRMLNPSGRGVQPPTATVQVSPSEIVKGPVVSQDEFQITVTDAAGMRRSFPTTVKFSVENKLNAHFEQLGKYTDTDMHNVYAYLQTLK